MLFILAEKPFFVFKIENTQYYNFDIMIIKINMLIHKEWIGGYIRLVQLEIDIAWTD